MGTVSFHIDHYDMRAQFEAKYSGSLICGRGPDDEVPDILDIRGWLEVKETGFFVRDFLPREIEELTVQDGPVDNAMFDAIWAQQNDPDDDWWGE